MTQESTELLDELTLELSQTQFQLEMTATVLHHNEANNIVKNHVIAATSMGLIPIALFDIAALSTNQHTMLRNLCRHFEVEFDSHRAKLLITSLMGGSLPVLAVMGLSSVSKFIPGIGTLGGSAGVALSGGAVTYATGQTFIRHFNMGGTLDNFMPERFSRYFKKKLKKGKRVAGKLKPDAVAEAIS
jgi:uncharacterized protein (DUF697 family)